jgi:hypothetical protein
MRGYKSIVVGVDVKDKKINDQGTFYYVVGIVSWMQNQIKDMRCQVRGHNTKNPNRFYYKSLEIENVGNFMKNSLI